MTGGCWPTADQTLLLQAAFLEGDRARQAFAQWRSRTIVDRPDRASTRLVPLLYWRLHTEDRTEPLLSMFRQEFEGVAARNAAILHAAADAIHILTAAHVDTMLLKGAALVARGIMPRGARSMADCDVLVPEAHALAARDALVRHGWRQEGRLDADLVTVRHAVPLQSPSGRRVDLHWHALAECCEAGADASFWRAAEPVTLEAAPTRTPCAADMVLHSCVHGLTWSIAPTIRWIGDALSVIRFGPPIDWERLVDETERRMLVLPITNALRLLTDAFDAPVPPWVVGHLAKIAVPRWASAEYRVKLRRRNPWRQVRFHWFQHRRLSASGTVMGDLRRLPSYVRRRWRFPPIVGTS